MKNKKQWMGCILFLVIALAIYVPIAYALRPIDPEFRRYMISGFYAEEEDSLDVVTLGSSAMYRFWNSPHAWEEYGITSYNLCSSSQLTEAALPLIKEAEKTQDPELYIIDVRKFYNVESEEEKKDIATRYVTDSMNYSLPRMELINSRTKNPIKRFRYYFDLYFYHGEWESLNAERLKMWDNTEKDPMKGWRNIIDVQPMEEPTDYGEVEPKPIRKRQEKILRELLEYCEKKDIEVLFVSMPYRMREGRLQKSKYMESVVNEYGFNYVDCNLYHEEMGLDYSQDFYDAAHVNSYGSQKVTSFLSEYILENYDMDLTHSESVQKEWDEVVELNRQDMEALKAQQ